MKDYVISQIPHSFSFLIGFYGKCSSGETPCLNYNLESPKSLEVFDSVYEVNQQSNNTGFSYFKSDLSNTEFNHFTELECGKSYYFVIKPGTKQLTIPHLFVQTNSDFNSDRVTDNCDNASETPTPTFKSECCSNLNNSIFLTGSNNGTESLNGVKAFMFEYGGMFCFDSLSPTYYPSRYNFKSADGNVLGYITTTGYFLNKNVMYTSPLGVCYVGLAETQNGFNILEVR